MATYAFKCTVCGAPEDVIADYETACTYIGEPCFHCDGVLKRDYSSVQLAPVMQEHYNTAVGKPISDRRQMDRELHIASELATERTGIQHRFAQVDGSEAAQTSGIDPDLQEAIRRAKKEGRALQREYARDVKPVEYASVAERREALEKVRGVNARTGERVA